MKAGKKLYFIYFPLSIFPVLFYHRPLMLIIFNYLLVSLLSPNSTTSTKSAAGLQNKPFQIWTSLLHWDPPHGPAPNLFCGQENYFPYKSALLPLNLLPKSEGFLDLSWEFTDPMQCGMVLEKKCGCALALKLKGGEASEEMDDVFINGKQNTTGIKCTSANGGRHNVKL